MRAFVFVALSLLTAVPTFADPLPSWREGPARDRIIAFVEAVTDPGSQDFVPQADRIAVFDNDGTLWAEQPVYFQAIFAFDVLSDMAEGDPSILTSETLKSAAAGDYQAVLSGGVEALLEVITASHTGVSVETFQALVADWLDTARHPTVGLPYDQMTYQPMVELLRYLRDEGFGTYIVSGGGLHFMRVFSQEAYNLPPQNVLGSYGATEYQIQDGKPVIIKTEALAFVDDKDGKPVNIERVIGKRPIFAAGNSDGDFAMLEWTTSGDGPRFGLLVHHTDGDREFAYDRDSHIGQLVDGLDKGPDLGWLIVDMARDWDRIFSGAR